MKKPVIITIVIVAAAAILIGGGIYLYPHMVERTISQVAKNDMTDIVEIELSNGDNGKRAKLTDKEDISEITGPVSYTHLGFLAQCRRSRITAI